MDWWQGPLRELVGGRRGDPRRRRRGRLDAAASPRCREAGATDVLVVGAGEARAPGRSPTAPVVVDEEPDVPGEPMAALRAGIAQARRPAAARRRGRRRVRPRPATPSCSAMFLGESPTFAGRPVVAHRRPAWVALEDKTRLADAARPGRRRRRAPSVVVPIARRGRRPPRARPRRRHGLGGRRHRGLPRWRRADALGDRRRPGRRRSRPSWRRTAASVRIMPFLDGVATSIHGIVLPDGVAVLRPVELVTLRQGHELRYSGCATFWDPPDAVRDEMRAAARAVGEALRDDRRLPRRVHARRRGDRRRLPPDRAQPALRRRPQRHHAWPGRRAAAARARPRRRRPPARDQRRRPGGRDPRRRRRVAQRRDVAAARRRRRTSIDGAPRLLRRRRLALGRRRRAAPTAPSPPPRASPAPSSTPARTPVGPSVGERSVAFWRFADREMGTAVGPLTAPPDVTRTDRADDPVEFVAPARTKSVSEAVWGAQIERPAAAQYSSLRWRL